MPIATYDTYCKMLDNAYKNNFAYPAINCTSMMTINAAINDLDRVTLGWSLDEKAERAVLELTIKAKEGTKTAERLGQLSEAKTKFGGFRVGGAAVSCGVTCTKPVENPELLDAVFEVIQAKVAKRIDKKVESEQKAEVLKKFAAGLLDVARETKQTGKV